jgi:Fe-S cluster biosynthesis and repair protein YggX
MANMKHNKFSHHQHQSPASAIPPTAVVDVDQSEIDFVPFPDEVARRAYLNYINQGAQPGHDVQHWLAAEAQLIAERNLTRVHGFHNRT